MLVRRRTSAPLLCSMLALGLSACNADAPPPDERAPTARAAAAITTGEELLARWERTLPWGAGAGELSLHHGGYQDPTWGPAAVAVAPTGAAIVLDQLAARAVGVGPDGEPVELAEVPRDAVELAAGPDGAFAAWSRVRARSWLYDERGTRLGDLAVPRSFMLVTRMSLTAERSLVVHTDNQDRIALGTPSGPIAENSARRARRFGAAELPDGRGVFLHAEEGRARLLVLEQPDRDHEKPRLSLEHELPGEVTAGRVLGAHQTTTCLRLERVESTPEISVDRRLFCTDAVTGEVLLDEELPPPGIYVPRTELAMNAGRLALLLPTEEGARIMAWKVPVAAKEVQP